jgi:hypothetical protein
LLLVIPFFLWGVATHRQQSPLKRISLPSPWSRLFGSRDGTVVVVALLIQIGMASLLVWDIFLRAFRISENVSVSAMLAMLTMLLAMWLLRQKDG